jgi:hypothetical protein
MSTTFWINANLEYSARVKFVAYNCNSSGLPQKFTLVGSFPVVWSYNRVTWTLFLLTRVVFTQSFWLVWLMNIISRYDTNVPWMCNYQSSVTCTHISFDTPISKQQSTKTTRSKHIRYDITRIQKQQTNPTHILIFHNSVKKFTRQIVPTSKTPTHTSK